MFRDLDRVLVGSRAGMNLWTKPWAKPLAAALVGVLVGVFATLGLGSGVAMFFERAKSKAQRTMDRISPTQPPGVDGWVAEDGFRQELHSTGLNFPARLAFVPNPGTDPGSNFYYVAELPGTIRVVTRKGDHHKVVDGLLNYKWQLMDELGVIGLDVDPALDRLYIALTYWDNKAGVYRNRVDALSLAPDGRSVTARTTLLDMKNEATVASYQIQFVAVSPDGLLYVGVGSGGNGQDAQNPDRFAGKILRMDKQGHALPDNPFYDASHPDSARSYTYALGFRNPFDIDWHPETGVAVVSDVGPDLDRILRLDRGTNYCFGGGTEGTDMMRTNALFTWGPNGNFAPTGVAITPNQQIGFGEGHSLLVGLFGPVHMPGPDHGKRVSRFAFESSGHVASGPRIATRYQGRYYSSVTDVDRGPDGIYFIEIYGLGELPHVKQGRVYRLTRNAAANLRPDDLLAAGKETPQRLFESVGCIGCHDLDSGPSRKEGPTLRKLADRLDSRLNSSDYANKLGELMRRDGEYFANQRPNYQALLGASGKSRIKLWFTLHLKDPRFDDPNAKMPSFAHLPPATVEKLASWLL
jgi:glucose/arabinose dehydrogenase